MTKRQKKLTKIKKKTGGRDNKGHMSTRHRGGAHKRFIRKIDWKRDKRDIPGTVEAIEYDPNRNANIALILYPDGERRYILAPAKLEVGDEVIASENPEIEPGNALPLKNIPLGVDFHNLEIKPGKGGQMVRGAGTKATILSKEDKYAHVKLPSTEVRKFLLDCWATIGQVGNKEHIYKQLGKAGSKRHRGIRPTVRGVAQHPGSHPHGGGEGRSPIGMPSPKSPWGKKTLGKKTRKKRKYSDKLIVKRRDEK